MAIVADEKEHPSDIAVILSVSGYIYGAAERKTVLFHKLQNLVKIFFSLIERLE